jgi:outer membrane protein assembly factor BamB
VRKLAALISLTLISFIVFAGDWPQFRGPNADGIAPDTGINKDWKTKPPKELWRINLTDDGYAGPSVAAGKMYIVDHQGAQDVVRAVDITNGSDAWTFKYDDAAKHNFGYTRGTPAYDNGKLYIYTRTGTAYCLDAAKGTKLWSRDLRTEFRGKSGDWNYAASVTIDGDKAILCPGGGASAVALDKNTGKDIWKCAGATDKAGYATPAIATLNGKKQYIVFAGTAVMGVDAASGTQLWSHKWVTRFDVNAAMPLVIGTSVFITSGYGTGCALVSVGAGGASQTYTTKDMQSHFNTPVLFNGKIYGTTDPGDLVCIDPQSGKALWRHPGFEKGGVVAADGVIIALSGNTGDLVMAVMKPDAYQELGRIKPLAGQSWTAPILADKKLYVRNKQALVCLDLK